MRRRRPATWRRQRSAAASAARTPRCTRVAAILPIVTTRGSGHGLWRSLADDAGRLSTHPHRAFEILFVFVPLACLVIIGPRPPPTTRTSARATWTSVRPSTLQWQQACLEPRGPRRLPVGGPCARAGGSAAPGRRGHGALRAAWDRLLATAGFREALLSLEGAWREVARRAAAAQAPAQRTDARAAGAGGRAQ